MFSREIEGLCGGPEPRDAADEAGVDVNSVINDGASDARWRLVEEAGAAAQFPGRWRGRGSGRPERGSVRRSGGRRART